MKRILPVCLMALLLLLGAENAAAQWRCLYATWDDETNGTGHNTTAVGVIQEDVFISLVMTRGVRNFMIPYYFADSSLGRVYTYGYGTPTAGIYQVWTDGAFDQVQMFNAFKIAAMPDGKIYVANNDPEHNILVFDFLGDTISVPSPFPRVTTGSNSIFGIEVDANGYVYVCNDSTVGVTTDVKIYNPVNMWSPNHNDPPIQTINLPDGVYKGITVSPNGQQLFVSDYDNRRILKYVGGPTTGYSLDAGFNFQLSPDDTIVGTSIRPGPLGLAYRSPNNILFAAVDAWLGGGVSYPYGRVYLINPNTGALVSSDTSISIVDGAAWNFAMTGGYNLRTGGTVPGNASGYTSLYDVEFDEAGFLYTQSHYGWTVDKWQYNGTLPTITSVEEIPGAVPGNYRLEQNYPNPFNPATSIEFRISKPGFVSLKVYDLLGSEVEALVNEHKGPGSYRVTFDASNLPSGTYFYTLRSGNHVEMKKMVLIR